MRIPQIRLAALALFSGVALGGCAYGFGDPYGGGYGGVSVGYGSSYGYDPYGYGYGSPYGYGSYGSYGSYGGYGYGYGSPYGYGYDPFGWYGNSYYPGTGIYVYDRNRRSRVWTDAERKHWRERLRNRSVGTTSTVTTRSVAPSANWSGFNRGRVRTSIDTTTSSRPIRERWQGRSSVTTSSTDTSTRTRSNNGSRGRGRDRSNEQ